MDNHDEKAFLNAMVREFCLSGKNELVFSERLLNSNSDLNNKQLAEVLESQLTEEGKLKSLPEFILRDCFHKGIIPQLKKQGYAGENRWEEARKWLFEVKYPIWKGQQVSSFNLLDCWQWLREKAKDMIAIKPILLEEPPLSVLAVGGWDETETAIKQIPLNSLIHYQIQLPKKGYLLLLEKFSGNTDIVCLCPSFVSPSFIFDAGEIILPQKTQYYSKDHFTIRGSIGIEEVLAIISPIKPTLDWLPSLQQRPLSLTEKHLQGLINMVNLQAETQILWTQYQIV